jgi:hypothetical protein
VLIESAPGVDGIYVVTIFWSLADADFGWNSTSMAIIVDLGGAAGWVDDDGMRGATLPADVIIPDATLARPYPTCNGTATSSPPCRKPSAQRKRCSPAGLARRCRMSTSTRHSS